MNNYFTKTVQIFNKNSFNNWSNSIFNQYNSDNFGRMIYFIRKTRSKLVVFFRLGINLYLPLTLVSSILLHIEHGFQNKLYRLPPGPTGLPFLGVINKLDPLRVRQILQQWKDQYGDIYSFTLPGQYVVVVSSLTFTWLAKPEKKPTPLFRVNNYLYLYGVIKTVRALNLPLGSTMLE